MSDQPRRVRVVPPTFFHRVCNATCKAPADAEVQVNTGNATVCTALCREHLVELRDAINHHLSRKDT